MSSPQQPTIPIVIMGITRHTALLTANVLEGTPYYLAAVLDLTESPEPYQYTPQNLGVVLHTLHPRPRVLLTGTAVSDADLEDVKPVWEAYVRGAASEEDRKTSWVALSKWHATTGPPPEGWDKELFRQLDAAFR